MRREPVAPRPKLTVQNAPRGGGRTHTLSGRQERGPQRGCGTDLLEVR